MASACDGCLGSAKCWVCLGRGQLERSDGELTPCGRCHGSGVCPLCENEPARDVVIVGDRLSRKSTAEADDRAGRRPGEALRRAARRALDTRKR